jgi:magnesium chelatase family protein
VHRYLRRLSGPILDRVDLHLEMGPVPSRLLLEAPAGESSATVRARVEAARERQRARGQAVPNGRLDPAELERVARPSPAASELLIRGAEQHRLSGRATSRVLRVARTLADLEGRADVDEPDVATALGFRASPALA